MSLTVIYLPSAIPALRRLRGRDPAMFARARQAIGALAGDPRPESAVPWGGSGIYRLHEGSLRVLYQVDEGSKAVYVLDVSLAF